MRRQGWFWLAVFAVLSVPAAATATPAQKASDTEFVERVEKIRGARDVNNKINLLPVSQMDDRIRVTIANQIYSDPLFVNYSRATPPIHVIVENGHVTLLGIVASDIERRKADFIARTVSGVFSVDDRLRLESELRGE